MIGKVRLYLFYKLNLQTDRLCLSPSLEKSFVVSPGCSSYRKVVSNYIHVHGALFSCTGVSQRLKAPACIGSQAHHLGASYSLGLALPK